MRFERKTAIVTGGSRDIGRAICLKLASEGANVVVNYNSNEPDADATLAAIEAVGIRPQSKQSWCDLTRGCHEDCSWLIEQAAIDLRNDVGYWYAYANHEGQRHLKLAEKILTGILNDLEVCS